MRDNINQINNKIYQNINNGVYKAGFATTQEAYEEAYTNLFKSLDNLEKLLSQQRYLVGNTLTEADIRLFTTLVRFDAVYVGHFKCNKKRIQDYPNLFNYTKDIYQIQDINKTVNFEHIKKHYYQSHTMINPTQVTPLGADLDFSQPHDRGRFSQ